MLVFPAIPRNITLTQKRSAPTSQYTFKQLARAVVNSNEEEVTFLLAQDVDIFGRSGTDTILHLAVQRLVVSEGAFLPDAVPPDQEALQHTKERILRLLCDAIKAKAKTPAEQATLFNPLEGMIDQSTGRLIVNAQGGTPLMFFFVGVCTERTKRAANLLIEFGADIKMVNPVKEGALHWAVGGGRNEWVNFAIERGAPLDACAAGNLLHLAVSALHPMLSATEGIDPEAVFYNLFNRMSAQTLGHHDLFYQMLSARDQDGDTLLTLLAEHQDNLTIFSLLLVSGLDINTKNGVNRTPIELLVRYERIKTIEYLIKLNHLELNPRIVNRAKKKLTQALENQDRAGSEIWGRIYNALKNKWYEQQRHQVQGSKLGCALIRSKRHTCPFVIPIREEPKWTAFPWVKRIQHQQVGAKVLSRYNMVAHDYRPITKIVIDSDVFFSHFPTLPEAQREQILYWLAHRSFKVQGASRNKFNQLRRLQMQKRHLDLARRVVTTARVVTTTGMTVDTFSALLRGDFAHVALNIGLITGGETATQVSSQLLEVVDKLDPVVWSTLSRGMMRTALRISRSTLPRAITAPLLVVSLVDAIKAYQAGQSGGVSEYCDNERMARCGNNEHWSGDIACHWHSQQRP